MGCSKPENEVGVCCIGKTETYQWMLYVLIRYLDTPKIPHNMKMDADDPLITSQLMLR